MGNKTCIGHFAHLRGKVHSTSLPGPLIDKQYNVLGMHICLLAWLCDIMHSTWCAGLITEESP